jgi:hypothetical protein
VSFLASRKEVRTRAYQHIADGPITLDSRDGVVGMHNQEPHRAAEPAAPLFVAEPPTGNPHVSRVSWPIRQMTPGLVRPHE